MSETNLNGIDVTEGAGSDHAIGCLPTAVTAFVGRTLRGPVARPVLLRSFADYQQVFGGLWQPSPLSYAVEQFFENGGREAYVVRVVNGGAPATLSIPCGEQTLTLEALSPGSREVLRASVDYDNIGPAEDDRFNLVVQRVRAIGSEHIEDQEIFRRISITPGSTRFVASALQESMLVRMRGEAPGVRPDRTFRPGARHPIGYIDSNPDGDDGAPLTDYDLIGSPGRGTGLFALRNVETAHFLYVPPPTRDRDVGPSVLLAASQFCRERRMMLVVDPPSTWDSTDEALQGLREMAFHSENALMCFPRVLAFDRLRGRYETFPNGAAVAGALARMDVHRPLHGHAAKVVGRPMHVAALYPPTGQPRGEAPRMMIAPLGPFRPGSPSKFPTPDNQRLIQQAATLEVPDQCGDRPVALLGMLPVIEDIAVIVPGLTTAVVQLHHPHSAFHQSPGHEARIGKLSTAVVRPCRGCFLRYIEDILRRKLQAKGQLQRFDAGFQQFVALALLSMLLVE